jgi:predicted nuclease of predicted toxin-antitoxin system
VSLKFFFDECVDEDIASALRAHSVDVKTTTDLGRKGLKDEEQVAWALAEDRVIYTVDQDFLRLAHRYLADGRPFAGVVYHQQGQRPKHNIIDSLLLINTFYDSDEMRNRVEFI